MAGEISETTHQVISTVFYVVERLAGVRADYGVATLPDDAILHSVTLYFYQRRFLRKKQQIFFANIVEWADGRVWVVITSAVKQQTKQQLVDAINKALTSIDYDFTKVNRVYTL